MENKRLIEVVGIIVRKADDLNVNIYKPTVLGTDLLSLIRAAYAGRKHGVWKKSDLGKELKNDLEFARQIQDLIKMM
jgi:hypothetical protein